MFSHVEFDGFRTGSDRDALEMHVKNMAPVYLNAVRRAAFERVPTVSFDTHDKDRSTVRFVKNTTRFNNQVLGLRLSLVPVCVPATFDVERYEFHLDEESGTEDKQVQTTDFKIFDRQTNEMVTEPAEIEKVFPRHPKTDSGIIIVPLKGTGDGSEKEVISIRATLARGVSTEHTCFSPVVVWAFDFAVDPALALERKRMLLAEEQERIGSATLPAEDMKRFENRFETIEKKKAQSRDENGEANDIRMTVETTGVITPRELVGQSIESLVSMFREAQTVFGTSRAEVTDSDRYEGAFDVKVRGFGHTLGAPLQAQIVDRYVGSVVDYCGYVVPHPLKDDLVFCVRFIEGVSMTPTALLAQAAAEMADGYAGLRERWEGGTGPARAAAGAGGAAQM